MSIRYSSRKIFMGVLAVALPLTSVAFLTSPAGAATKPPPFTGAATGSVSCSAPVIKIKFSPAMTLTTGGSTITASGKLGGCVTSGSNVTIKKGKITGTFGGTGTGCAGLATGLTSNVNFTISWKGKTNAGGKATLTNSTVVLKGAGPSLNGSGDEGFALPNPSENPPGGSVSGSFPSATITTESHVYSAMTESAVIAKCGKKLTTLKVVSGSVVLP